MSSRASEGNQLHLIIQERKLYSATNGTLHANNQADSVWLPMLKKSQNSLPTLARMKTQERKLVVSTKM